MASDSDGAQAVTRASRATSERSSPVTSMPPLVVLTLRWPEGRAKVVRRIWQTWASPQWLLLSSQSPLCQLPDCAAAAALNIAVRMREGHAEDDEGGEANDEQTEAAHGADLAGWIRGWVHNCSL